MQRFKQLTLSVVAVGAITGTLFLGCTGTASAPASAPISSVNKKYAEEELGLRKESLYKEDVIATPTHYPDHQPGTGKVLDRAFENAPPMIPHTVEDMLPITRDNNMCTSCHMPEVAEAVKATAIPKSHFVSFRPKSHIGKQGELMMDGKQVSNANEILTVQHDTGGLHQGRFNCTACHAPQAEVPLAVANEFQADFRTKDGNTKSNFIDVLNEGVQ